MDYSTPGLPHHLLEFQFNIWHWWCHPAISSSDVLFSFCPQSFPTSGTFRMSGMFTSDNKNTVVSASASVLPVNIQDWSPLRLIGLISLLAKGLSGVFSITTVWRHPFFDILLLYGLALTIVHDHWEDYIDCLDFMNTGLDYMDIFWQSNISGFQLSRFVIRFRAKKQLSGCSHHLQWFGAQEEEICHYFHISPFYLPCSNGARCHDLSLFVCLFVLS